MTLLRPSFFVFMIRFVALLSAVVLLLSGCSATFPLVGNTSEDQSHHEFMSRLQNRAHVLEAFGEPHAANEAQDDSDFTVWYYAADPATNVIGNTSYRKILFNRFQQGGDPRYDLPSRDDFPEDIASQGDMIWQFQGDSVSGWCTYFLDFSQQQQSDRLTRRGLLVDATVMILLINLDLIK
jgi:hypothetical protein